METRVGQDYYQETSIVDIDVLSDTLKRARNKIQKTKA
jgi:hypothetical protein